MVTDKPVVIVGAGLSGVHAAESLRNEGYKGRIVLIDRDDEYPYDRPPLSKEFIIGTASSSALYLRTKEEYDDLNIELKLGCHITDIDTNKKTLLADDGTTISWENLILATGSRLKKLSVPGGDLQGVHYLKTFADAKRIKQSLHGIKQMVIVGAGFIGAELASSFKQLGIEVTIIERSKAPMAHLFGEEIGNYFLELHRSEGVNVITGDSVARFEGEKEVNITITERGEKLSCQAVVVGIGVEPNTSLLEEELVCNNGYVVDEFGETSTPGIYAAGDCASWPYHGRHIRVEHWDHAINHGKTVAKNIVQKQAVPYASVPYFWSDQYERRIQYFGHTNLRIPVWRGDRDSHQFSCFYINEKGIMEAALLVNQPKEALTVRRLIKEQHPVDRDLVSNPEVSIKKVRKEQLDTPHSSL